MKKAERVKYIRTHFSEIKKLSKQIIAKHDAINALDITTQDGISQLENLNKEIKALTKEYSKHAKYANNPPVPKKPKK